MLLAMASSQASSSRSSLHARSTNERNRGSSRVSARPRGALPECEPESGEIPRGQPQFGRQGMLTLL